MSTSSLEVISTASEAAPSVPPREASTGRASAGIRKGLSHTREQLTDTVERLAHKVDAPSGVRDKLSAAKDMTQTKIGEVARHLHKGKETVQDNANEVTRQAKNLKNQAWAQVPPPVAGHINHLTRAVRQRPASAAAIVLTIVVFLLLRRLLRKAT